jgi:uncharacterized protein (TIGR04255 family)
LKIGQELPVDFQELLRNEFPKFGREEATGFRIGPGMVEALPSPVAVSRFGTEDDAWRAGLAVDNVSLETTGFVDFADFEHRFRVVEGAVQSVYGIDHYSRVGLRYINVFRPEEFPGGWLDRFNPRLLGAMADPVLGAAVRESQQVLKLADEDWTIVIRHGTEDGNYRLDIDHATEARVQAADVLPRLGSFSARIYQVFRWAISQSMHEEMEPEGDD